MSRLLSFILLICAGLFKPLSAEQFSAAFASSIDQLLPAEHITYSEKEIDFNSDKKNDLLYCYFMPYESKADFTGIRCLAIISGKEGSKTTELALPLAEDLPCIKWNSPDLELHSFYRHTTTVQTFRWTENATQASLWKSNDEERIDENQATQQTLDALFQCDNPAGQ